MGEWSVPLLVNKEKRIKKELVWGRTSDINKY